MQKHRRRELKLRPPLRKFHPRPEALMAVSLGYRERDLLDSALDAWTAMRRSTVHLLEIGRQKQAAADDEQRLKLRCRLTTAMRRCSVAMREFRSIVAEMDEPARMRLRDAIVGDDDGETGNWADDARRSFPGAH